MFWLGLIGWMMAFCGVYLIGEKRVAGFYVNVFANALLIVDAVLFAHWSLVFAMLAFTTLNIVNIWKWQFKKQGIDEAKFFSDNPGLTMTVWKYRAGIDIEISHDTHEAPDAYVGDHQKQHKGKTERELRQVVMQMVLDKIG